MIKKNLIEIVLNDERVKREFTEKLLEGKFNISCFKRKLIQIMINSILHDERIFA